ncbi:MAG: hypothetical protein WCJ56_09800, partial [bacterium]
PAPSKWSGIRPGTPSVTSRCMAEAQMVTIGNWMCDVLENPTDITLREQVKEGVIILCNQFPIYDYMETGSEFC